MSEVLVTGAAGFIGFHVAKRFLSEGLEVAGLDNLNSYYDPQLKRDRLAQIASNSNFTFHQADLTDRGAIEGLFANVRPKRVLHFAAQAGVRYSLVNPQLYVESNVLGFQNILEACRASGVSHLVYASSSSVYGERPAIPSSETDPTDQPVSLYAATKRSNELMAYAYSHLHALPTTGLRLFSVYGPWGRPDMAAYSFTKKIIAGETIQVYNHGDMQRDFTYVDDIVEAVARVAAKPPKALTGELPYRIYNVGNGEATELLHMLDVLEKCIGQKTERELLPLQAGDVITTCADMTRLKNEFGFQPATSIDEGLTQFVDWYRSYNRLTA